MVHCHTVVDCHLTVSYWYLGVIIHYKSTEYIYSDAGTTGPACAVSLEHPFLGEARAGSRKKKSHIPCRIPREVYRSHA